MTTAQYGNLEFKEAISFFRGKLNLPSERWADVWRDQHNLAFMVAGAVKEDLLADLRQAVDNAIANGRSLSGFKKDFKAIVKKHGWAHTGSPGWRARVIYDTNMRQSYNAGRYHQLQTFEYWRYKHGDSRTPRLNHQAKDGTVLPKDDPFWQVWYPQNGWGCKCKVFGETARSIKRKGLKVSESPTIKTRDWTDKVTGEVHQVPVGIDPGFDYAPGKISQAERFRQQRAAIPPLVERLKKRIVPSAFSTVPGVNAKGLDNILEQFSQINPHTISQLDGFLQKHPIKTLILKPEQMQPGQAAEAIAPEIATYLAVPQSKVQRYFVPQNSADGFTNDSFDHITMHATSKQGLSKVQIAEIVAGLEKIIVDGMNDTGPWDWPNWQRGWFSSAQATSKGVDDSASRFLTWLHEMGHQMHYKLGTPDQPYAKSLTFNGQKNYKEWFTEHLTLYLLAPQKLAAEWPQVAEWFNLQLSRFNP